MYGWRDLGFVVRRVSVRGEDGGIDESPISQRKLLKIVSNWWEMTVSLNAVRMSVVDTHQTTCEVNSNCPPVLPQRQVREWVEADPPRVVI